MTDRSAHSTGRPRVLVTHPDAPWPSTAGKRLRAAQTLAGLEQRAEVDAAVLFAGEPGARLLPPEARVRDLVHLPDVRRTRRSAAARALVGRQPWRLAVQDWDRAREAVRPLARRPYDAVWFGSMEHAWHLGSMFRGVPWVVDVDDVESVKIRTFLAARELAVTAAVHDRLQRRVELPLWLRVERRVRLRAAVAVVCSELDRERFATRGGSARTVVVPNTYPDPGRLERHGGGPEPVLAMLGTYTNEPVADAAVLAARQVLPLVRQQLPATRLRLSGKGGEGVLAPLAGLPGVDLVGPVDSPAAELARADVVLAPIPWGGGTKLKVIEALALGVPVVTTPHGTEGLDAVDGTHLLVGRDPRELAGACVALLRGPARAAGLSRAGRELYEASYRPESALRAVSGVVDTVLGSH